MSAPILSVEHAFVRFRGRRGAGDVQALDDVSIDVRAGETVGIVGESGSGKSTLGRVVLGLQRLDSGELEFLGERGVATSTARRRQRAPFLQAVFQDPYSSLNPSKTVGQILAEPLRLQGIRSRDEQVTRVRRMLERVGLDPDHAIRYPRSFSGGQRQRIAIARALMLEPRLVVCDEALSALDQSVQAQIANLLMELQASTGISYLFIGHDLGVVRHVSHRIAVMQKGRIVEFDEATRVTDRPADPYTRALLDAAPVPDPVRQRERRAAARLEQEPVPR